MVELIQQKAFLGKEFLTWLWFRSERDGARGCAPCQTDRGRDNGADPAGCPLRRCPCDHPARRLPSHLARGAPRPCWRARSSSAPGCAWPPKMPSGPLTLDGETFHLSGAALPAGGRLPLEDLLAMRGGLSQRDGRDPDHPL